MLDRMTEHGSVMVRLDWGRLCCHCGSQRRHLRQIARCCLSHGGVCLMWPIQLRTVFYARPLPYSGSHLFDLAFGRLPCSLSCPSCTLSGALPRFRSESSGACTSMALEKYPRHAGPARPLIVSARDSGLLGNGCATRNGSVAPLNRPSAISSRWPSAWGRGPLNTYHGWSRTVLESQS